jgi:hypothetical protein
MCGKPFVVDPMSYLFGQPYEQFKRRVRGGPQFKPSFDRLMLGHGLEPREFLEYSYERLLAFLRGSRRNSEKFIRNALSFQWDRVWETISSARDLLTAGERASLREEDFRPSFLVPPYFRYDARPDRHLAATGLNAAINEYCYSERGRWQDIFPMVFVAKETLRNGCIGEVVALATEHDFPGNCVWVDGLDEREATVEEIAGLITLVDALARGGRQIVIMHGGFFSLLLYRFGATCVSHGVAYGEAKSALAAAQQTSGPAPVRYYVLELHRFLTLADALQVLRERNDLICNCLACRRVVRGNPENVTRYENEEALAEIHFLYNRNLERRMVGESTREQIVEHLNWSISLNEDIEQITKRYRVSWGYAEKPIVDLDYMRRWRDAIARASGDQPS